MAKQKKYVKTNSDFLGTKASDRRRVPPPGKTLEDVEWKRWWLQPKDKIGNATETIIMKIEMEQSLRYTSFVNWARLYGNWEAQSWGANLLNNTNQDSNNDQCLRLNLIQSVIDAAAAKIAKDQPQPYFITTGAKSYFDKLKAEKMTKYVKGVFQKCKVYEKAISQFRDAEIYGTGALHFYDLNDEVQCDWVPTFELRVADYDGMNKDPRSMHRVRMISKEQLKVRFDSEEQQQLIEEISTNPTNRLRDFQNIVDMVRIKESWHLPSKEGADDGIYAVTINDKCLLREKYDLPIFPIVIFRWYDRPLGFYGRSVTEEVYSVQMSLDELLNTASQSYNLMGIPIWFVPDGAQVPEDHIMSNFIARLISYRGNQPPTPMTPEPLPSSFFEWVGQHIQWVFQIVGLSQTSATSQNQLGPNASGAALREMIDIETSRFAQVSTSWEQNFVKCAHVVVAITKRLAAKKDIKVEYTERKQVNILSWKDVEIDSYRIDCDPVSQLPDSVAGRIQTVQDYIDRQWISQERGMELLNLDPDLQQEVNIQTSSLRRCEMILSEMVENGIPYQPEPYMINLPQLQKVSQGVYNMLALDGCPEDRLQLVRNWINALIALQTPNPLQQTQPQAALAPQTAPAGAPAPLPPGASSPQAPPIGGQVQPPAP